MIMELRDLEHFRLVLQTGNISKAALQLGLAQPALSRQLKQLEEELGVALLTRHSWGVQPTAAGSLLAEQAERVLAEARRTRELVQGLQAEPSGALTLAAPTSFSAVLFPEIAQAMRQRYPKVRLHLREGFSAVIHDWALSGQTDLAVLYETRAMGPLATEPLLQDSVVVLGPAGHFAKRASLKPAALAALPLILPARPHRLRLLVDEICAGQPRSTKQHGRMNLIYEVDALPVLIDMVRRRLGFTVLPYSSVHALLRAGDLSFATLQSASTLRRLCLARPAERAPAPALLALRHTIIDLVRSGAAELRWTPLI